MRSFVLVASVVLAFGSASGALAASGQPSATPTPMYQQGHPPPNSTPVQQSCYWNNFKKAYKLSGGDFDLAHGTACGICKIKC